jgi:hypothetical protein
MKMTHTANDNPRFSYNQPTFTPPQPDTETHYALDNLNDVTWDTPEMDDIDINPQNVDELDEGRIRKQVQKPCQGLDERVDDILIKDNPSEATIDDLYKELL